MSNPLELYQGPDGGGKGCGRGRLLARWMDTVKAGDVLVNPYGTMRVVREVRRDRRGLRSIVFAIKHCSWTGRGYTILSFTDLRVQGWRPTGARVRLDTEMDCWLQADIRDPYSKRVTCCEAKDMP